MNDEVDREPDPAEVVLLRVQVERLRAERDAWWHLALARGILLSPGSWSFPERRLAAEREACGVLRQLGRLRGRR